MHARSNGAIRVIEYFFKVVCIVFRQYGFEEEMISASRNPGPTNESTGLEVKFGAMKKVEDAILNLIWERRLSLYVC